MPAPENLAEELRDKVRPSLADVRRALGLLRGKLREGDVSLHPSHLEPLAGELGSPRPSQEPIDLEEWPTSAQVWISHERMKAAIREAAAELVVLGEVIPGAAWESDEYVHFPWSREGTGSVAQVPVSRVMYPVILIRPARFAEPSQLVTSTAQFLEELGDETSMSGHVRQCLKESVEAQRRNLPLAAGIMLGSASEGAWIELAEAIVEAGGDPETEDIGTELQRTRLSAAALQDAVSEFLSRESNRHLSRNTGVSPEDLRARAEYYRALRNYAHPHVDQRPVPDFENISMSLLEAIRYFRAIYSIIGALQG